MDLGPPRRPPPLPCAALAHPPQIRIVASNPMKSYVSYALSLLQDKGHSSVVLKAMGRAINKTVAIGEGHAADSADTDCVRDST